MPSGDYIAEGEVVIDRKRFRLASTRRNNEYSRISRRIIPLTSPAAIIGNPELRTNQHFQQFTNDNWIGGGGMREWNEETGLERFYTSGNLLTFVPKQLSLGPLAYEVKFSDDTEIDGKPSLVVGLYKEKYYIVIQKEGQKLYRFNENGSSLLSAEEFEVTAKPTDTHEYSRDNKLYIAYGTGYMDWDGDTDPVDHAGSIADDIPFAQYFADWDGKLFALCEDKSFYSSTRPDTDTPDWTKRASVPGSFGDPRELLNYFNVVGEPILLAVTTRGMWFYNGTDDRWENTTFTQLDSDNGGQGAIVDSDGEISYPVGQSIWKYSLTGTVRENGFDRDDGIPFGDASIIDMFALHGSTLPLCCARGASGTCVLRPSAR